MSEKEIAALQEKVKLSEEIAEKLVQENDELKKELAVANEKLGVIAKAKADSKPKKPVIPEPFEVGGKIYRFKYPAFRFGGKKYIAEKEVKNEKLLEQLIKLGSPVLEEVEQ